MHLLRALAAANPIERQFALRQVSAIESGAEFAVRTCCETVIMDFPGNPEARPNPDHATGASAQAVEARLRANQRFTDVLHELMHACAEPPSEADLLELLQRSLESIVEVTEGESATFMVRDHESQGLVLVLAEGNRRGAPQPWSAIPDGRGIAHWVAREKRAAVINNASNDPRCGPESVQRNGPRIRSVLAAPVLDGDEVLGVVEVINKREGALFAVRDQRRLELVCHFDGKLLADFVHRSLNGRRSIASP